MTQEAALTTLHGSRIGLSKNDNLVVAGIAPGGFVVPQSYTFGIAAGAANVSDVTITPIDGKGNALTGIREVEIWLSDSATGEGLTATSASGTVQAASGLGTVLTALTAKKHILGLTKAAGAFVLEITDTAKTGFYVCVRSPLTGHVFVSSQLITANFG